MIKKLLTLLLVCSLSPLALAGKGGKELPRTEDAIKLNRTGALTALSRVSKTLGDFGFYKMEEVKEMKLDIQAQGELATKLDSLNAALKGNKRRAQEMQNNGLFEMAAEIMVAKGDFAEAAKKDPATQGVEKLPDNIPNLLKTMLDNTTSISLGKEIIGAIVEMKRQGIDAKSVEKLSKTLAEMGVRLADIVICK